MDERGAILFECRHTNRPARDHPFLARLNQWRTRLFDAGLIGVNQEGIGFGNLSARYPGTDSFVISGTQTGEHRVLDPSLYAGVFDVNLSDNTVTSHGRVLASSESMSHSILYETDRRIGTVVHVHSARLWKWAKGRLPTTAAGVEAGTPQMALNLKLLHDPSQELPRVFVMGGHVDGLIAIGSEPAQAARAILDLVSRE